MNWARNLAQANQARAKEERDYQRRIKELDKEIARLSKPPKMVQYDIWQRVDTAIGASFPDGDPIDHLSDLFDTYKLTMEQIDRAVNRYAKIKTGMYGYLAMMWQDHQADRLADAKTDHNYESNPFYYIQDGKVVPIGNPWASDL